MVNDGGSGPFKEEKVIYRTKIHGIIYFWPMIALLVAIFAFAIVGKVIGGLFLLLGAYSGMKALLVVMTTELVITNKRVVSKFGILQRNSMDTNLNKIEGVTFHQGFLGHLFGYGTVVVRGTGGDHQGIPYIRHPEDFRNALNSLVD